MPGFYEEGEYDLAGTIVGVVGRSDIITGETISAGDTILGLGSSGLHTNGYSLARKVLLEMAGLPLEDVHPDLGRTLGEELLAPHRSYAPTLLPLIAQSNVKGMVHITGGGFGGNIPRVVPGRCKAIISKGSWEIPPIFNLISRHGNVPEDEMFATFNMGLGMLVIVEPEKAEEIAADLMNRGEKVYRVGTVETRSEDEDNVVNG